MANKIELTAAQLASLDLLIKAKQTDPTLSGDARADAVNQLARDIVMAVGVAAAVAAAVGVTNLQDKGLIGPAVTIAKNASLQDLLEIRKNAIVKK